MSLILFILIAFLFSCVLPSLSYLLLGWIFTRFERTRDLGVRFLAMSMLAPRLTSVCCHRRCEVTPCKNWTCENYYHSNIENK